MPLRLEYSSALDVGRARHNNEDAVLIDPSLGLCILADGMGGYNAGEVASDMATRAMRDTFRQWLLGLTQAPAEAEVARALVAAAQEANRQVFTAANTVAAYAGMGTTLVAAVFERQHVWIGHLGDSRAYRLRNGRLGQLTRDHSLLQEQVDAGLLTQEEAAYALHRNLVTRAIGVEPQVVLEVHPHDVKAGDTILLCSDGLSDMLSDTQIAQVLQINNSLDEQAAALVEAANAAGGRDNISVILAKLH